MMLASPIEWVQDGLCVVVITSRKKMSRTGQCMVILVRIILVMRIPCSGTFTWTSATAASIFLATDRLWVFVEANQKVLNKMHRLDYSFLFCFLFFVFFIWFLWYFLFEDLKILISGKCFGIHNAFSVKETLIFSLDINTKNELNLYANLYVYVYLYVSVNII